MPNIKSAAKRMKTSARKQMANRAEKSRILTHRTRLAAAIEAGDATTAQKEYRTYCSVLDKAAKHGAIKGNCADRRKSRAFARLQKLSA